ncbi:hypothetical protein DID96_23295 [Burkholderia sp. Bp8963]|uniref:hypothetical protein n=1 Tax=Burkholderia sp. Bp8963 TaxID=2184547 RepID=UPI000F59C2E2|nr:hypothetical protein [Burkholderia sp. Bp8963]RQS66623.1 hypothetical protein DID96_23295 [Burkholderia sp. Bp8963]
MSDTFELIAISLPPDMAPEALPAAVKSMVADCWPGMSRGQLIARARRHALRLSLRAREACAPGEIGRFCLYLTADGETVRLVAHLRRVLRRRKLMRSGKPVRNSGTPPRDPRQASLF